MKAGDAKPGVYSESQDSPAAEGLFLMEKLLIRDVLSKNQRINQKKTWKNSAATKNFHHENFRDVRQFLSQHNIIVLIPAYNEAQFLGPLIARILNYPVKVLVIDDGSTDKTSSVALLAGAEVLSLSVNQGKGTALNYGFQEASKLNPDAIVMIDGDGQHYPEEIPQLLFPILRGQSDISIGSRYLNRFSGVPLIRRIGHFVFNQLTNLATGVHASDSQSGFRAFSRLAYRNIQFHSKGFSVESEMQFLAGQENLRVTDIPISIRYHNASKRPIIYQGLEVFLGIIRLIGYYRPQLFSRFHGVLFFFLGLVMGFHSLDQFSAINDLPVSYVLISLFSTLVGLIILTNGLTDIPIRGLLADILINNRKSKNND